MVSQTIKDGSHTVSHAGRGPLGNYGGERVFRDRVDPLDRPDDELWRKYRFTRAGLLCLVDQLAPALSHPTARNCSFICFAAVMCGT